MFSSSCLDMNENLRSVCLFQETNTQTQTPLLTINNLWADQQTVGLFSSLGIIAIVIFFFFKKTYVMISFQTKS